MSQMPGIAHFNKQKLFMYFPFFWKRKVICDNVWGHLDFVTANSLTINSCCCCCCYWCTLYVSRPAARPAEINSVVWNRFETCTGSVPVQTCGSSFGIGLFHDLQLKVTRWHSFLVLQAAVDLRGVRWVGGRSRTRTSPGSRGSPKSWTGRCSSEAGGRRRWRSRRRRGRGG